MMKDHAIVFTAKEKAEFPETELDETLAGDEILVKDDYDLISAGTETDDYRAFLNLLKAGSIQVEPIIGEVVSAADAENVYRRLNASPKPPLGVLLDWTQVEQAR